MRLLCLLLVGRGVSVERTAASLPADVKPSNVLINTQGQVKMCDFGISGYLVDSVAKTMDAGCKPYMAVSRNRRLPLFGTETTSQPANCLTLVTSCDLLSRSRRGSTPRPTRKATTSNLTSGV